MHFLLQKFEFNLTKIDSNEQLMSIVSLEPKFIIQDPKEDNYKFVIRAINEKGPSQIVEILKEDILNATLGKNLFFFPEIVSPYFRTFMKDFPSKSKKLLYDIV